MATHFAKKTKHFNSKERSSDGKTKMFSIEKLSKVSILFKSRKRSVSLRNVFLSFSSSQHLQVGVETTPLLKKVP